MVSSLWFVFLSDNVKRKINYLFTFFHFIDIKWEGIRTGNKRRRKNNYLFTSSFAIEEECGFLHSFLLAYIKAEEEPVTKVLAGNKNTSLKKHLKM